MTDLARIRVPWSGVRGGAAVSTFYTAGAPADLAPFSGFFTSIKDLLPSSVVISFPNSGDIIDDVSGDLVGAWTTASEANVTCTNTGVYAAPAGAIEQWHTDVILDSHRLRGRTYLVPVCAAQLQNNGTLEDGLPAFIGGFADTLVSNLSGTLRVWHRPIKARTGPPAVEERAGNSAPVTSTLVPDKVAILRSRRD